MEERAKEKTHKLKLYSKKAAYIMLAMTCVLIISSILFVQAVPLQETPTTQEYNTTQDQGNELSAIPLLVLILPIAAVAAYVLEWATSKGKQSASA